jgi:lauroyl/myristoyl acyltransferase
VPAIVYRGPQHDRLIHPVLDTRGIRYQPTGDEERDVHNLTRMIMQSFEPHIRAHPEQWFIFRRMWPEAAQPVAARAVPAEA